jgi:hypothetical protein
MRPGMPASEPVRYEARTCPLCSSWTSEDRPREAWLSLAYHYDRNHHEDALPPVPDALATLRGNWEHAAAKSRAGLDAFEYHREANAAVKLGEYLQEHNLLNTPANPHYAWMSAVEAYTLWLRWETATLYGDDDDAADDALKALIAHLDASGLTGSDYDPRRRHH